VILLLFASFDPLFGVSSGRGLGNGAAAGEQPNDGCREHERSDAGMGRHGRASKESIELE
jgi:hypothetical protein